MGDIVRTGYENETVYMSQGETPKRTEKSSMNTSPPHRVPEHGCMCNVYAMHSLLNSD